MEQISLFELTMPTVKIDKPIRLITLFSGIDSQAMALRNLGANFEHYRAVEFDKYAIASLNEIHKTNFPVLDIKNVKGSDLGIVDTDRYTYLLTYSFPCNDISISGQRAGMGEGTRSGLLWEVERLLNETENLPQILLMENVTMVHADENREYFEQWIEFLHRKGYSNYCQDLKASEYGVAQSRDRTFMVSILGEYYYKFPKTIKLRYCMNDYLEENVDENYYMTSEKALNFIAGLNEGKI